MGKLIAATVPYNSGTAVTSPSGIHGEKNSYTKLLEELARRKVQRDARSQKARRFFEQDCPQLLDAHYNWFIIIEPNSGDYFIEPDEEVAYQKARQKYPSGWVVTFHLNETGTCGKI